MWSHFCLELHEETSNLVIIYGDSTFAVTSDATSTTAELVRMLKALRAEAQASSERLGATLH